MAEKRVRNKRRKRKDKEEWVRVEQEVSVKVIHRLVKKLQEKDK